MSEMEFKGVAPQDIKPPELGIGLAKLEMREKQKFAFEQALLSKIKKQYIDQLIELKAKEKSDEQPSELPPSLSWLKQNLRSYEDVIVIVQGAEKLRPILDFNGKDEIIDIKFDLEYPGLSMLDDEVDEAYRSESLTPRRDQQFVTNVDKSGEPLVEHSSYSLNVNFRKLWDETAKENPQGAEYYLDEILTEQEALIHGVLEHSKQMAESFEAKRKQLIQAGQPAGQVAAEVKRYNMLYEEETLTLQALLKFRKRNIPGV